MFFFLNITTDHKEYCDYFYMTVHNVKNLQLIKLYKIYYFYPFWARAARQNRGFLAFGAQGAPKFSIWQREPKPKMPMSDNTSESVKMSNLAHSPPILLPSDPSAKCLNDLSVLI